MQRRLSEMTLQTLDALIAFKVLHQGNTPTIEQLSQLLNLSESGTRHQVENLILAGCIQQNAGRRVQIYVPFATWCPPDWYKPGEQPPALLSARAVEVPPTMFSSGPILDFIKKERKP
jgi:hypothetical protein